MIKPGWIWERLRARWLSMKRYWHSARWVLAVSTLVVWTIYLPATLQTLAKGSFTFDVGGALGGLATLAAAVVAWIAVKVQIADQQNARELDAVEQRMLSVSDRQEGLSLARNFVEEVEFLATLTVAMGEPVGRYIARGELDSERHLKWFAELSSDPFALQAMSVPTVEARKYVWWTVRRAEAYGRIALQVIKLSALDKVDRPALDAFDALTATAKKATETIRSEQKHFDYITNELSKRRTALKRQV